ncbi:zinc finger protein 423-like isoform X1 [Cydia pomonella]|uniref:zinc finger protein 423-like isoform X1 n=1 Tax=Cydia pomonella TaxID=82600 RepID=UPI002ADE3457|nr:zinc finger protein 423-like isoform X1 [Cydia pomonella]
MELEVAVVKQDAGLCRCCHSEGCFKDLNEEYVWMDETVNYGEMLQECFNIKILQYSNGNGINGASTLICEDCAVRLREACIFRKQVLSNEKKLAELLGHVEPEDSKEQAFTIKVKTEPQEIDIEEHGVATQSYTTPADGGNQVYIQLEPLDDCEDHGDRLTHNTDSNEQAEPAKKRARKKPAKRKGEDGDASLKWVRSKTPKQKQIENLQTILEFSNAVRFKNKTYLGYICGDCDLTFLEPSDLRTHTEEVHKEDRLILDMQALKITYIGVKLDISDLKCTICFENMDSLSDFKEHIVKVHDKVFHNDIKDHIFPFKLHKSLNNCVLCDSNFESFRGLYLHMHTHFKNYNCNKCGATFAFNKALSSHTYTHKEGQFVCEHCEKVCSNKANLHHHIKMVHSAEGKVSYCPYCKEKFSSYYMRNRHLIEAHDSDVFKCTVCSERFAIKAVLLRHMKVAHKM